MLPVGGLAFTPDVAILRHLSQSFMFGGLHLTLDAATLRTSFLQVLPGAGLPFSPGAPTATLLQVLPVGRLAFTLNVAILRQLLSQSFMFGRLHLTLYAATVGGLPFTPATAMLRQLLSQCFLFVGLHFTPGSATSGQLNSKCFLWDGWPLLLLQYSHVKATLLPVLPVC